MLKRLLCIVLSFIMIIPFFYQKKASAVLPLVAGVALSDILVDLCITIGGTYLVADAISNSSYRNAVQEEVEKHLNSSSADIIDFKEYKNGSSGSSNNNFDKNKYNALLNAGVGTTVGELLLKEQNNIKHTDSNNHYDDLTTNNVNGLYYSELVSGIVQSVLTSKSVCDQVMLLNNNTDRKLWDYYGCSAADKYYGELKNNPYRYIHIVNNFDSIYSNSSNYAIELERMKKIGDGFQPINPITYELFGVSYFHYQYKPVDANRFLFKKKSINKNFKAIPYFNFMNFNTTNSSDDGYFYIVCQNNVIPNKNCIHYNSSTGQFANQYNSYSIHSNHFKSFSNALRGDTHFSELYCYNGLDFNVNGTSNSYPDKFGMFRDYVYHDLYLSYNSEFFIGNYSNFYFYYTNGKLYDLTEATRIHNYDLSDYLTNDNLLVNFNNNNLYYYNNDNISKVNKRVEQADQHIKKKKVEIEQNDVIEYPYIDYVDISNSKSRIQELPDHSLVNDDDVEIIDNTRLEIVNPSRTIWIEGDPYSDNNIKPYNPELTPIEQYDPDINEDPDINDDPNTNNGPNISDPNNSDPNNSNTNVTNSNIAPDLTEYFPFCLPFDLIKFIRLFEAEPVAPSFNLKVPKPNGKGYYYNEIKLDSFDPVAGVFRFVIVILFCIGLIKGTAAIMGGGRD